jgi:hypothetical protein
MVIFLVVITYDSIRGYYILSQECISYPEDEGDTFLQNLTPYKTIRSRNSHDKYLHRREILKSEKNVGGK